LVARLVIRLIVWISSAVGGPAISVTRVSFQEKHMAMVSDAMAFAGSTIVLPNKAICPRATSCVSRRKRAIVSVVPSRA